MGQFPSSAQALLWRPHEPDSVPEEVVSKLVQPDGGFEVALFGCIGRFSWKMSSWKDVASKLEEEQSEICQTVSNALELEKEGFAITEIQIHILEGAIGKQEPAGWSMASILTLGYVDLTDPRFVTLVDQNGQYVPSGLSGKTYAVRVGDDIRRSTIPALPSLQDFGIKARFDELQQKCTDEGAYGLLIQHPYTVIEWLGSGRQLEQWGWRCEMVIASIKIKKATLILQLSVSPSAIDGSSTIAAVAISGEELCSMVCNPEVTTAASLLEEFGRQAKTHLGLLKLITPKGDIIDYKAGHLLLSSCIHSADQLERSNSAQA